MKKNNSDIINKDVDALPEHLHWTPELVKRFWDGLTHTRLLEMSFSKQAGRSLIIAIDHLLNRNGHVLDFGAGDGYLLNFLCERGLLAAAFEPSEERANQLHKFLSKNKNFLGVIDNNSKETFDVVIMAEVIEHILNDELVNTLKRVVSLVKPGGVLVVTTPNNEDLEMNMTYCPVSNQLFHRWQHVRSFTDRTLVNLLSQFGIKEIVTHKVEFNDLLFVPGDTIWGDKYDEYECPSYLNDIRQNIPVEMGGESNLLYIGRKII